MEVILSHTSDTVTVNIDSQHRLTMDDNEFFTILRLAFASREGKPIEQPRQHFSYCPANPDIAVCICDDVEGKK